MGERNVQTDLQRDPLYLNPECPGSWGEEASTAPPGWTMEELPVRLSVLVNKRVLDAIQETNLHDIDVDGLYDEACRCPRM